MPTYAYRCTACAHEFEAVQKMSDDPFKVCPECGAPIKRIIFPSGIVFKGSGWYINDSRKSSSESAPAKAKTDSAGDAAAPKPKTESAPAPKTESAPAKAAAD